MSKSFKYNLETIPVKEFLQLKDLILADHIHKTRKIEKIQKGLNENSRHLRGLIKLIKSMNN